MDNSDGMDIYSKLCRVKEMKGNENDPLYILLQLTIRPMEYKIVRLSIVGAFIGYIWSTSLNFQILLTTFDLQHLLRYGSASGIQIFILINLGVIVFKFDEIKNLVITFKNMSIPLGIIDGNVNDKIVKLSRLTKIVVLTIYLTAGISSISLILSPDFFRRRGYCFVWICEKFPKNCGTTIFIITLLNFPVTAVLIASSAIMSYFALHAIFQTMILNQLVKNICSSMTSRKERYESELYQNIICQKLKICIYMHKKMIMISVHAVNLIYGPIIMFSIGAVILGSSFVLEYYTIDIGHLSLENFGLLCFVLAALLSACLYITTAQFVKDESEETHYLLTQLPWYFMNHENARMYSIFMRKAEKPLSFLTDLIEVNFLLLVRIFRALYSVAAVFAHVTHTLPQKN